MHNIYNSIKTKSKPIFDILLAFALFLKINSNVPMYADEFIFKKIQTNFSTSYSMKGLLCSPFNDYLPLLFASLPPTASLTPSATSAAASPTPSTTSPAASPTSLTASPAALPALSTSFETLLLSFLCLHYLLI